MATRQDSSARGHGTAILVGGGLVLAGIIAAIAAATSGSSSASAPSPPSPGNKGGKGTPCPSSSLPVTVQTLRTSDSGTTVAIASNVELRTALLITPAQIPNYDWQIDTSDNTVITKIQRTTGPDPSSPNGTDRIDVWRVAGAGTAVLSGQLLPKSGTGPAIAAFQVTVTTTCAGGNVGGTGPSSTIPGSALPAAVAANHTYNLFVANQNGAVKVPTVAAAQALFDAKLGKGAVTVVGAAAYGSSGQAARVTIQTNQPVTLTAGTVFQAFGINTTFVVSSYLSATITG